jgi:hypothetical protein
MSRPLTFWGRHRVAASLYDFAVCLVLYSLFVPALHEASHWLIAKAYGVDGVIQLGFPLSSFQPSSPLPTGTEFYTIYFAGGILVSFAYLLMWSRESQLEEKAGMLPVIVQQTIYGVGEGLWALWGFNQAFYNNMVLASQILGLAAGIVMLIRLFRFWLTLPG